jgi:hypothetical protein
MLRWLLHRLSLSLLLLLLWRRHGSYPSAQPAHVGDWSDGAGLAGFPSLVVAARSIWSLVWQNSANFANQPPISHVSIATAMR